MAELNKIYRSQNLDSDSAIYRKAFDDYTKWVVEKHSQVSSAFKAWVWSD